MRGASIERRPVDVALLLLCLLAPPALAQAKPTLANGKTVAVDTGAANKVEVDVATAADTVTRVLVSGTDEVAATVAVTAGGKPVDAALHKFQGHACVEWPNAAGRTCTLAIASPAAATKYIVKRVDLKPPTAGDRQVTLGAPIAFASSVWCRAMATKGKVLTFRCSGDESLTSPTWRILGADAATVRADLKGNPAEWTPAAAERVWVRTLAAKWPDPNLGVFVGADVDGLTPVADIDMGLSPDQMPEKGQSVEVATVIVACSCSSTEFDLEAGVTYVVEVRVGALKDPVVEVRDAATRGLLAWNDDGGTNGGAKLTLKYPAARTVAVVVRAMDPAGAGKVTIKVAAE